LNLEILLSEREIYRSIMSIARAMDNRDWDVLRKIFAPDIIADLGTGNISGAEEVISFIRSFLNKCGTTQHLIGNVVVDIENNIATSKCYVCDMHLSKGADSDVTFRTMGEYTDTWQQQNERWVLSRRVKDNRATIGSMDVFS